MKRKALASALVLAAINVHALEGKVVDKSGEPIAGAKVEVSRLQGPLLTDDAGRFQIPEGINEVQVIAPGYAHKIVHLHEHSGQELLITLSSTVIEQVDVIGLPIHASVIESAMPVTVLSGEELRKQQAATLGDSLESQPGVNSNFHGNVASTPVIRGLSGPRVLITQNSLDVSDVSRVGPDHAVSSEVSTAKQVEILRGPGTLFYGSGAIGGVVNIVDQRVPTDSETAGEVSASYDTVNSQKLASFNLKSGVNSLGLYADGFWRESDDYEVPELDEHEEHEEESHEEHSYDNTVANSAEESSGYTLGSSYVLENGYVGIAYERLDREYGIPGHSHGGHEDEHEGEEGEHEDELDSGEHEEESVFAELEQDRYQFQSELKIDSALLSAINARAAYTDYRHSEVEDGEVGTLFANETTEARVDLFHNEWLHWKGGIHFHYKLSEISAEGEEAFTPPSEAETFAFAIMEEMHTGNFLWQWGARVERVTTKAENVLLPDIELHAHDGEAEEDDHDHEHEEHAEGDTRVFAVDHEFTPFSLSAGTVWEFKPGYNVGLAFSHAERAPSAPEILSFGPHIGTRSYEVGALFDLHSEGEEVHFELSDDDITLETSNNIDLSLRKFEGDVGFILNAFFNKVDDYYYQQATGFYAEFSHDHTDEHEHDEEAEAEEGDDDHGDELPIYLFTHDDAEFYGLEAQAIWQITPLLQGTFFSDFVHAELADGGYLPRTPPLRFGFDIDFSQDRVNASVSWTHYSEQDKVAELETPTDGYNMLDAFFSYSLPVDAMSLSFFVKGENLLDEEARVHTSFIKDVAPRPGRNISLGIRGSF